MDKVDPQIMTSLLLDTQGNPCSLTMARQTGPMPQARKRFQFQLDCITKYGITPEAAVNLTGEELFTEFAAGKIRHHHRRCRACPLCAQTFPSNPALCS